MDRANWRPGHSLFIDIEGACAIAPNVEVLIQELFQKVPEHNGDVYMHIIHYIHLGFQ